MEFDGVRACAALQFLTGSSDSSVVASKSNMRRVTTRSYLVVYSIWEFACRMRNLCCFSEDGTVHFWKTRHELLQPGGLRPEGVRPSATRAKSDVYSSNGVVY